MQAEGEIGGGPAGFGDEAQPVEELVVRLIGVERPPRVGGHAEGFVGDAGLDGAELFGGEALAQRQQQRGKEILRDGPFPVRRVRRTVRETRAGGERRVFQEPGADVFAVRDPDLRELGLERAVVEQRDLHGAPGGQRPAKERAHGLVGLGFLRSAAPPHDPVFPPQPRRDGIAHPGIECPLRITPGATRQPH